MLHTGDRCRLDADGDLYFVGRTDEVIESRGERVPPHIELRGALPRSSNGEIARSELE